MIKYISHRGNLIGSNPNRENNPEYIISAINKRFDVEIDVWFLDDKYYLGHDIPQYETTEKFLNDYNCVLWCHAKTLKTLIQLKLIGLNTFYHTEEDGVLTTKGWIWKHPKCKEILKGNIVEICLGKPIPLNTSAVCSDYIEEWRQYEN